MKPTLVVGLGSAYGDDQLGWIVLDRLADALPNATGLALLKAPRGGIELLEGLESLSVGDPWTIVAVDAVVSAAPPGSLYGPEPLRFDVASAALSSHAVGFAELLSVVCALGARVEQAIVFGVEADAATLCDRYHAAGLSPRVQQAVPVLVERIAGHLRDGAAA